MVDLDVSLRVPVGMENHPCKFQMHASRSSNHRLHLTRERFCVNDFLCGIRTQMVESELLIKSLLDEGAEGLAQRILSKAGVDTSRFSADLDSFM